MPNYIYTAKSFDGQTENGALDVKNEHELAQILKGRGMILVDSTIDGSQKKSILSMQFSFFGVSTEEKIMITKNLGVMFASGLSLIKSFEILIAQAKSQKLKDALLDIKNKINTGENLSDALSAYPDIFSELFCNMIKVGEESGTLDDIFQILSLQLMKEHDLRSKIINAMIYPGIILMVMALVGVVMITFVLPSLNTFFTSLNVDIPIYTRALLYGGNFLSTNWYLLIVVPLLMAFFGWLIMKTKIGKYTVDTILLKMPLISSIVKKNNSAFLVRSLSSLTASGVSLIRSLEISSKTVNNHYFADALTDAGLKIKKGEKLSNALRPYQNLFPSGVIEMIEVGEETGKTSAILKKLADFYEQEAVDAIEKLSILVEPILIVGLGLAVGVFAFSIIQPMYSSLKSIQ